MSHLIPGEYDVNLNGVQIHYTVRGAGPVLIAHSGGPGTPFTGVVAHTAGAPSRCWLVLAQ